MVGESIKVDVKEVIRAIELLNLYSSGQSQVLAAYGHANKPSGFTKSGEFINYLLSASENGAIPWKQLF